MSWLKRIFSSNLTNLTTKDRKSIPEGVWIQCETCHVTLYQGELDRSLRVCHKCNHHFYIDAKTRLTGFLDPNSIAFIDCKIKPIDLLKFKDTKRYRERLSTAQKKLNLPDALVAAEGLLFQQPVIACAFEYNFMGGSMGVVVGEIFMRAMQQAMKKKLPFILFSASGGARMQEGVFSLMQMAKTSTIIAQFSELKLPFVSVLTNPTMGGVSASLAMLGDIILAEPNALIGFAGPRVIQQTMREVFPEGFQKSEFLLQHGVIDNVVDRRELRKKISNIINKLLKN